MANLQSRHDLGIVRTEGGLLPPDLLAHFRYPEDIFKVQRELLTRYHVIDAHAFYGGSDFWAVPIDPTGSFPVIAIGLMMTLTSSEV